MRSKSRHPSLLRELNIYNSFSLSAKLYWVCRANKGKQLYAYFIHSSFCVPNIMLPERRPNFVEVARTAETLGRPALSLSRHSSHKFHTSSCKSAFVCSSHCPAFCQIKRSGRASVLKKNSSQQQIQSLRIPNVLSFFISVPMDLDAVHYK